MATIKALLPLSGGRNKLADPRLLTSTMTTNGGTHTDTRPTTGGPDDGSYFRRQVDVPNTTSPMSMSLSLSGTSGIPVTPGVPVFSSWYARKAPGGGPVTQMNMAWYTAAGASISTTSGTGNSVTSAWTRFTQTHTPPATAAFAQPRLVYSGIALAGQLLDLAMAQVELGSVTTFTDNQTVNPLLILAYGFSRESRNIVLDLMGSTYPAVFLREAQSRSGTLTMLFDSASASNDADAIFQSVNRFHFQELAAAQDFHFIRSGPVTAVKLEARNMWTVAVGFREVAPL